MAALNSLGATDESDDSPRAGSGFRKPKRGLSRKKISRYSQFSNFASSGFGDDEGDTDAPKHNSASAQLSTEPEEVSVPHVDDETPNSSAKKSPGSDDLLSLLNNISTSKTNQPSSSSSSSSKRKSASDDNEQTTGGGEFPTAAHSSILDFFNPPASPGSKSPSGTGSYDEFMASMMGGMPKARGRAPDSDEISRRQQSRAEKLLRHFAVRDDVNRAGLRRAKKKSVKFGKNKGGGYQMEVHCLSLSFSDLSVRHSQTRVASLSLSLS